MRLATIAIGWIALWAPVSAAAEVAAALATAAASLSAEEFREHTETLAADSFEGREAGRAGGRAAATYLMKQLQAAGLQPGGEGGTYFQPFGSGYRNVLAVLPGNDPELRHEFLVLGAHFDHVGYGNRRNSNGPVGYIHNGADDNASGVAALLEVAEALQDYEPGLARTVVFVWWDAEEKGLWGSKHWLVQPTVDLSRVRLVVNVDMVGRLRESLQVFGTRSMPGLRMRWSRANASLGLSLEFPWKVLDNSDHYPFFQRQIPIAMLHTGLHDDYHRPSDDVSRLNVPGMQEIAELLLRFTVDLANQPKLGAFREASLRETERDRRRIETPQPKRPRLGVSWRVPARGELGVSLTQVWGNSAAWKAGLKPGDRIVGVAGKPLTEGDALRRAVAGTFGPLELTRQRGGEETTVVVELPGTPPRVGVSWRVDEAEPDVIVVSRVTPGFPADLAELRVWDRIYQLGELTTLSEGAFRAALADTEGPIELWVERRGQFRRLTLELPPLDAPTEGRTEDAADAVPSTEVSDGNPAD